MYVTGSTSSNRITGMVSGLDVDELVASAMEAEMYEYNKVYQDKQLAEWRSEAYQSVISSVSDFEDTYFNYLNSDTNMLSASTFDVIQATSSSSAVSVSASENALVGSHSVLVSQLATSAQYASDSSISQSIQGSEAADFTDLEGSLIIDVDGVEREVDLSDVDSIDALQTAIDDAVGSGKIEVSLDADGYLQMETASGSGVTEIDISETDESTLTQLGFGEGSVLSNRISGDMTLSEMQSYMNTAFEFNSSGEVEFSINGVEFAFDEDTSLDEMIDEINSSSDAGVTVTYKNSTGAFVITSDSTGAGETLSFSEDESTFLSALSLSYTEGTDAVVEIDGETYVRSENTFTLDEITYTLSDVTESAETVSVEKNTDGAYDAIVGFVDAYNSLIDSLNSLISEEYDSDYPPLTEEQKSEMSDDEIESWESIAKTGVLEDDEYIEDLLDEMRLALYESVEGLDISLPDIGISTDDYTDKGKLVIDEDVLKEALEEDTDAVISLFTQSSETYPGTTTGRDLSSSESQVRYREEGLMYRLYDAIEDKVSLSRDSNGNKGSLIELAGAEGDSSETDNILYEEIEEYSETLVDLEEWLVEKEEELYDDYTTMETYLSQMNAELEALSSMLGG